MKKLLYTLAIVFLLLSHNTKAASFSEGSLIKAYNSSVVYYIDKDGSKHPFPDAKTYHTWYDNFDNIYQVDISTLDSYMDAEAMPYKAGTKLITHQNTAKIYAVEPNGVIRWIPTEEIARNLYGDTWYMRVQDVIPGYFSTSYHTGEDLSNTLPTGTIARIKNTNTYYYIDNGQKRVSTNYQNYHQEDIVEVDNLDNYTDESTDTTTNTNGVTTDSDTSDNSDSSDNNDTGTTSDGGGSSSNAPPVVDNDIDNDGYNSISSGGNDCNDNNVSIHPGATDICGDGIDQDCSGADLACPVVDNDIDNDGYNSVASGGTDCNDNNASINPGATDICGDSIDQDCSGSDLSCPVPITPEAGQPIIESVSGSLVDGQTLTISGSGFGSQGPNVDIFDNFEGGTNGQQIQLNSATVGSWSHMQASGSSPGVYYSNSSAVSGNLSFRANDDKGANNVSKSFPATTEVFATWWIRHEGTNWPGEPGVINWKTVWLMEEDSAGADGTDITLPSTVTGSTWYIHGNRIPSNMIKYGLFGSWGHNIWRRVAYHVKFDQSTGIGDAQFWTVAPGDFPWRKTLDVSNEPVVSAGHNYQMIVVNGYGYDSPDSHPMFDDFYLATGPGAQARVEIGDSPIYSQSTNLSIFVPISWSDSEIRANINQGSFASGQNLYLFVIDARGTASNGYLISFN